MRTRTPIHFNSVNITGERVVLVPITDQYSETIFNEFTDEITQWMVPATPTHIDQIHAFIRTSQENMDDNIDLTLAILDTHSREFFGVCGLHGKDSPDEPILGIWLKKEAHGKRLGQEAIRFLVDWARHNVIFDFLVYPCDKDNIPSIKIAESLNGVIYREGKTKSMSGKVLNEVAYKIL